MTKHKKKLGTGWVAAFVILGLVDLALVIRYFLDGKNVAILNPKGLISTAQHDIMTYVLYVLLIIAIPSIFLVYFIAWKYRETNTKAKHDPSPKPTYKLDVLIWGVPTMFMIVLSVFMWQVTHKWVPQEAIASDAKPLTIQVVSLRWKWLFLYPEQKVASVNFVQLPLNTPVTFELTADEAPMSSFWIPNLGGQLYTMTGHVNRLNLMADVPGDYPGSSAEINGAGFAGMKFTARAGSTEDFNKWVEEVRQSPEYLDNAEYAELLKPSESNPVALYADYQHGLYENLVMKYMKHGDHSSPAQYEGHH